MPRKSRIDAHGAMHHIIVRGIESLIPNHFHLLLRTGNVSISTIMRRLLTGYALWYNRRHCRCGHLFQNRYKSILCQEDPYLLELVRYIHLNALRAGVVPDLKALDKYPYSGHGVLMSKVNCDWQNTDKVLGLFGEKSGTARRTYRRFVKKGISLGKRRDLTGGGLIRSAGGWTAVKALRSEKVFEKGDDRLAAFCAIGQSESWE